MIYKRLISTFALWIVICNVNAQSEINEKLLEQQILGTWHSEFKYIDKNHPDSWITARSEDIYKVDGFLVGSVDYVYPDRAETLTYEGRWTVKGGYMLIEITQTSGGYLSRGAKTKDKILSFSKTKMELLAEDGKIIVLKRPK